MKPLEKIEAKATAYEENSGYHDEDAREEAKRAVWCIDDAKAMLEDGNYEVAMQKLSEALGRAARAVVCQGRAHEVSMAAKALRWAARV